MSSSLSAERIKEFLDLDCCFQPESIELFDEIESTNSHLLAQLATNPKLLPTICTANHQTAGRGRLDRKWIAPAAKSIAVSFSYHFSCLDSRKLPELAILVAIITAETMTSLGAKVELKWPNDLYAEGGKLAGILIETAALTPHSCNAVIGIGINYDLPNFSVIDQPIAHLAALLPPPLPSREFIIATLANRLSQALPIFMSNGIKPFYPSWLRYDLLLDREITAYLPDGRVISGTGKGLNQDGTYRLLVNSSDLIALSFGEVKVRLNKD